MAIDELVENMKVDHPEGEWQSYVMQYILNLHNDKTSKSLVKLVDLEISCEKYPPMSMDENNQPVCDRYVEEVLNTFLLNVSSSIMYNSKGESLLRQFMYYTYAVKNPVAELECDLEFSSPEIYPSEYFNKELKKYREEVPEEVRGLSEIGLVTYFVYLNSTSDESKLGNPTGFNKCTLNAFLSEKDRRILRTIANAKDIQAGITCELISLLIHRLSWDVIMATPITVLMYYYFYIMREDAPIFNESQSYVARAYVEAESESPVVDDEFLTGVDVENTSWYSQDELNQMKLYYALKKNEINKWTRSEDVSQCIREFRGVLPSTLYDISDAAVLLLKVYSMKLEGTGHSYYKYTDFQSILMLSDMLAIKDTYGNLEQILARARANLSFFADTYWLEPKVEYTAMHLLCRCVLMDSEYKKLHKVPILSVFYNPGELRSTVDSSAFSFQSMYGLSYTGALVACSVHEAYKAKKTNTEQLEVNINLTDKGINYFMDKFKIDSFTLTKIFKAAMYVKDLRQYGINADIDQLTDLDKIRASVWCNKRWKGV